MVQKKFCRVHFSASTSPPCRPERVRLARIVPRDASAVGHSDTCANTRVRCQSLPQLAHCRTACSLPHSLPTATQLAHCHTACQRYITRQQYTACQLLHSSLIYRSPTTTAYQLPQSLPTVHSLPTVTQLANDVQITNCHRACQPPQSLQTVHSLPTTTQLANGIQLTNYHAAR